MTNKNTSIEGLTRYDHQGCLMAPNATGDYLLISDVRALLASQAEPAAWLTEDGRAVYEGDEFDCSLGLESKLTHTPDWQNPNRSQPDKLRFVYAVAKLKDGGIQFDVMSRAEVDGIRARSKSADNGPWVTDYAAMALKTVVRRLFKFLPVSIEMQQAVGLDEQAEAGLSQQNSAVIDGNFTEVDQPLELGADPAPAAGQPASVGAAEIKVEYDVMFSRIAQCTDLDVLDILADELRAMPPSDERTKLEALAFDRRAELGGAQ